MSDQQEYIGVHCAACHEGWVVPHDVKREPCPNCGRKLKYLKRKAA